jgi:hypothetical protein
MKINHKNIAAKATLVFNLYQDTDIQPAQEIKEKINHLRTNYEFQDFSFDYKKIKELKALKAMKK